MRELVFTLQFKGAKGDVVDDHFVRLYLSC
jgi:hypothetical protein